MPIKKCRLFIGVKNLITITRYSGLEPEVGTRPEDGFTRNTTLSLGVDRGTYPQAKTFMTGLNLAF